MLKKNDTQELNISSMTYEGYGVARYSDSDVKDFVVFVQDAAEGERAECHILKVEKRFAVAKIVKMITSSEHRVTPLCAVNGKCGGCVFGHISYAKELTVKQGFVEGEFRKNCPSVSCEISPIVPSPDETGYRNKAQFPISERGRCGYFSTHSHRIVEVGHCALNDRAFDPIADAFERYLSDAKVPIYHEETGKGLVRHLYIRRGHLSGETMVTVVATKDRLPCEEMLIDNMKDCGVVSLYININPDKTNVILGRKNRLLYGEETICDTLCGLTFDISPLSFYQINSRQAEAIYRHAKELLTLTKDDVLLDLYCGIGTIGLSMADSVKKLIGIEIIPDAVENAKKNAAKNNIKNADFFVSDADNVLSLLREKPNKIVVDPPRKGLDEDTVGALLAIKPEKIVYISCNPSTLSRDLERLAAAYKTEFVQPYDMFPRTGHVETLCLLIRADAT